VAGKYGFASLRFSECNHESILAVFSSAPAIVATVLYTDLGRVVQASCSIEGFGERGFVLSSRQCGRSGVNFWDGQLRYRAGTIPRDPDVLERRRRADAMDIVLRG
jgi:hypothetical protein